MIVPFIAVTRCILNNNKAGPSAIPKKCFIINHPLAEKIPNYSYRNFFSQFREDLKSFSPGQRKKKSRFLLFLSQHLPVVTRILKINSVSIARNIVEHVEFFIAQRIRRGQQMITLYSRLWDERALKQFFQKMKRALQKKSKRLIIGGSLVAFDWEKERIPEEELKRHTHEMHLCDVLRVKAFNGDNNNPTDDIDLPECTCSECSPGSKVSAWEPFIIEEDLVVWKMKDPNYNTTGLYCYKLYGRYSDVTPKDFLEVFLDTKNRTKWDAHAADLKVIDSEPSSRSEVIYWETRWPALFSNRDYVFKRRYHLDEVNKMIVVVNKSTEHPSYPPVSSKARVTEYWSYIVIKATDNLDQPGMEFSLTYYDNPGIALPSAISLWVTVQGMPEYLKRLRIEALAISEKRKQENALKKPEEESSDSLRLKGGSKRVDDSPPRPPSKEHEQKLLPDDYLYIFSSYFQKIRTTFWL